MNLLILSGGPHPYEESTPALQGFLKAAGHQTEVTEDAGVLADSSRMAGFDALIFNTKRDGDMTMSRAEMAGLTAYIRGGKGFVCIHIAGAAPPEWQEYYDITGGGWISGESYHPPYGQFTVNVKNPDHPGAKGISDFVTNDELYMGIEYRGDGNDVFLTADAEDSTHSWPPRGGSPKFMSGGTFPLAWTRSFGEGKVFVTLLGHNGLSFETSEFQKLVLNGVDWATSQS
ncbi:MAG: ThuA domain-containing protein [Chloroflexi bacterium]|nr:ThuA domain-containing protein [Chloroflexota bacterium]